MKFTIETKHVADSDFKLRSPIKLQTWPQTLTWSKWNENLTLNKKIDSDFTELNAWIGFINMQCLTTEIRWKKVNNFWQVLKNLFFILFAKFWFHWKFNLILNIYGSSDSFEIWCLSNLISDTSKFLIGNLF